MTLKIGDKVKFAEHDGVGMPVREVIGVWRDLVWLSDVNGPFTARAHRYALCVTPPAVDERWKLVNGRINAGQYVTVRAVSFGYVVYDYGDDDPRVRTREDFASAFERA